MELRTERKEDIETIRQLTNAAFKDMPFSNQTEAAIVDALRYHDALTISLVGVDGDNIVGHIAFSPVTINNLEDGWYGLGPVSVWPDRQKQGIGSALIREGLQKLKDLGAKGCVLLGDPNYYSRFGFECDPELKYTDAPAEYFQRLVFITPAPKGAVKYHSAFEQG
ncbi:N-acetyltransferase [Sneathiella marina]|uniref:N-acetyltransferase n=1 Tax=Sneathiella marina TaxID=2950108 RepID=A0ABY4VXH3_9PROT|nr:N-acetyltransferase [Sneathiella marina]USG59565.1 N-acetyltransferase [Sneathiella marina]